MPLVERILTDSADIENPPDLVFLGDYVDRGPSSREAIEFLMAVAAWPEVETSFLLGNH